MYRAGVVTSIGSYVQSRSGHGGGGEGVGGDIWSMGDSAYGGGGKGMNAPL